MRDRFIAELKITREYGDPKAQPFVLTSDALGFDVPTYEEFEGTGIERKELIRRNLRMLIDSIRETVEELDAEELLS